MPLINPLASRSWTERTDRTETESTIWCSHFPVQLAQSATDVRNLG